jgi:hypothetical protein
MKKKKHASKRKPKATHQTQPAPERVRPPQDVLSLMVVPEPPSEPLVVIAIPKTLWQKVRDFLAGY